MTTHALVPMASGFPSMILLLIVVLGFMFLVQRPLRKQQAAQRELQNQMAEGSRVMLTSGMFGTITHLGDKQAIVELAPGLEVTVLRQAISKAVTPDDEEFEFTDAGTDAVVSTDPANAPEPTHTWDEASASDLSHTFDASYTDGVPTGGSSAVPEQPRTPGEPWPGTSASADTFQASADQQVAGDTRSVAPHDENR